jgi:conjugative relaxase-like TrwC/TraI family protein
MMKVTPLAKGQHAYFEKSVAKGRDDYYSGRGEAPGAWRGSAAAALGLSGVVEGVDLNSVLEGKHPVSKAALRDRDRGGSVSAYDLTFSAPKSFSVLATIADDGLARQMLAAHESAVSAAMEFVEQEMARVRRGAGGTELMATRGIVAATYRHRMSRALDPQIHTHAVIANLAQGVDGSWTALHSRRLFKMAKTAGTLYQAHLRAEVTRRTGLQWLEPQNGLADLEALMPDQLLEFSRRRRAMLAAATAAGEDLEELTLRQRETFALSTRDRKDYSIETRVWRDEVRERAASVGLDREALEAIFRRGQQARAELAQAGLEEPAREVEGRAIADELAGPAGLTATENAFAGHQVLAQLAGRQRNGLRVEDAREELRGFLGRRDVQVLPGDDVFEERWTAADLVAAEQRVIAAAVGRIGEGAAQVPRAVVERRLTSSSRTLNAEQRVAVVGVACSGNGLDVIEASAGTGKTYLAGVVRELYSAESVRVIGAAPTATAARELRDEAGIPSSTIHRILHDIDRFGVGLPERSVLLLDEAGMADTRSVARLLEHAERRAVKVIAVGDSGQLASVQAGGWLRAVGQRTGNFALTETMRQRDLGERRALGALHAGAPDGWLDWAQRQGRIDVHASAGDAVARAVSDWDRGVREHGPDQSVMIARDNARRRVLNDAARELRRTRGELGSEVDYGSTPIAVGDRIICRSNDPSLDVDNGMRGTVTVVDASKMVVETDAGPVRELPAEYAARHVEHAYCLTGHGMQGATVEQAVVVANPGHMTAGWSYSALSRARATTRLHLVGEEAQAAADQRATRREEGPQLPKSEASGEQVIAATRFVMGKRDDEDLAVDQIRGLPGPGRAGDPALTGAVAGPAPIAQEAGADRLEAEMSPAQRALVDVDRERQRLRLQRQALPHRDLQALQAARAEHDALLVLREQQALAAAAVPPPGRLSDPHGAERGYAHTVLEMTDARISATNRQMTAIAARLGDGGRQRGHELDSIDERLHHLDAQHQERTGDVVARQQEQPPQWLVERIGPRPPDGTARRRWDAAVRNSTLAQLHDTPGANLRAPLPGQPPQEAAKAQAWRRAIESQRAVVGVGRGGMGR